MRINKWVVAGVAGCVMVGGTLAVTAKGRKDRAQGGVARSAEIGKPAPAFSLQDSHGKTHNLSGYKGKIVVLEWMNGECPFVKKHYHTKNMQTLQKAWTDKHVAWLSIISSAQGKQGYCEPEDAVTMEKEMGLASTAMLLDTTGEVGHVYGAKCTPHMFIVDAKGLLAYQGAIDDRPTAKIEDVEGAKNYVSEALTQLMAGKPVIVSVTKPYGCSIKY